MSDVERLLNSIKKLSIDAVDNAKPSNLVIGKVISVTPLKIELDNDVILTADMLSFVKPAVSEGTYDTTFDVGVTSAGTTNVSGTATVTGDAEVTGTINELIELAVTGEDIKPNTKASGRITFPVTLRGDSQGSGPVTASGNAVVNGRAKGGSKKVLTSYELWIANGDEVALLMHPGGNRFLIIGRTTSADNVSEGKGEAFMQGPPGPPGPAGPPGKQGPPGESCIPDGGTDGQLISKQGNGTAWVDYQTVLGELEAIELTNGMYAYRSGHTVWLTWYMEWSVAPNEYTELVTLPEGWRPPIGMYFPAEVSGQLGRLHVSPVGKVSVYSFTDSNRIHGTVCFPVA